jgi:hypothetical protein
MECLPYASGGTTTYSALYSDVSAYCTDLGIQIAPEAFEDVLATLHKEQCLAYFRKSKIQPTQFGLNKYN